MFKSLFKTSKGEQDKWKKTKRLIFKSTLFGDDTDRAMQKNDGSWTYFANDVTFHMDKVNEIMIILSIFLELITQVTQRE